MSAQILASSYSENVDFSAHMSLMMANEAVPGDCSGHEAIVNCRDKVDSSYAHDGNSKHGARINMP